jgi:hypothetical protein
MQVEIVSPKLSVRTPLRHLVDTRLRYALGPFRRRITAITVTFEPLAGARGGRGFRCRVRVLPLRGSEVVVEATADSEAGAISRAAECAARCLRERTRRRWLTGRRMHRTPRPEAPAAPGPAFCLPAAGPPLAIAE